MLPPDKNKFMNGLNLKTRHTNVPLTKGSTTMLLPAIMELLKIITAYNKILIVSEENQVVRM